LADILTSTIAAARISDMVGGRRTRSGSNIGRRRPWRHDRTAPWWGSLRSAHGLPALPPPHAIRQENRRNIHLHKPERYPENPDHLCPPEDIRHIYWIYRRRTELPFDLICVPYGKVLDFPADKSFSVRCAPFRFVRVGCGSVEAQRAASEGDPQFDRTRPTVARAHCGRAGSFG
jgi:hypothetical protein